MHVANQLTGDILLYQWWISWLATCYYTSGEPADLHPPEPGHVVPHGLRPFCVHKVLRIIRTKCIQVIVKNEIIYFCFHDRRLWKWMVPKRKIRKDCPLKDPNPFKTCFLKQLKLNFFYRVSEGAGCQKVFCFVTIFLYYLYKKANKYFKGQPTVQ